MGLPTSLKGTLAGLAVLALSGCSPTDPQSSAKPQASQVIARVNGKEVSELQYRHALRQAGVANPSASVRAELMDKLVDRELAVQEALARELERRPEVLIELEEARRDVLARAWADEVASTAPAPDERAAAAYFLEHPALFAERRIYRMREIALSADLPQIEEARQRFAGGRTVSETLAWLKAEGASVKDQVVIRAAEQLPIESLPRLGAAVAGDTVFFETPRGVIAYELLTVQPAPLAWEDARPLILAYLGKQAGKRAVVSEKAELRRRADIRYAEDIARAGEKPVL